MERFEVPWKAPLKSAFLAVERLGAAESLEGTPRDEQAGRAWLHCSAQSADIAGCMSSRMLVFHKSLRLPCISERPGI